jgi:AraC-like DNA-binding protein
MRAQVEATSPVTFSHRAPSPLLSDCVEVLWYWSGYITQFARERLMPMGTVELVIQLRNPRASGSGMAGPRSESLIIERRATDEILGVHFKAGGAFPFLGCAFGELHNASVTLDELWGEKRARRLLELLSEAKTVDQKFQLLERWLMWIAGRPLKHHAAVSLALKEFQADPGLYTSARIARETNLSQRRFIELFRDEVGMTPKLFCRVQRFQNVITTIQDRAAVDWVDLALSLGYSDQSHFIHDFREFSGLSPSEYLGLRTEHRSHVRVAD